MNNKARATIFISAGLFLFFIDRLLKSVALYYFSEQYLINKYFGWQPFLNSGVAFGLPSPYWFTIFLTIPVITIFLFLIIARWRQQKFDYIFNGLISIFLGALSNLLDRLYFHHTIDYILILTGVINLADIMIVGGFIIYLLGMVNKE